MPTVRERARTTLSLTRRILVRTLAGAALFAVFLLCSFAAMRLFIHGREVTVPNLTGVSDSDAEAQLRKLGLHLSVENRFYTPTIATNHVLSQSPIPGARVRRGWQIRVTESLGQQQVPVPDVTGQDQHPAEFMLKRLQLELGQVAHIPGPGPTGTILAQSPPPNSAGLDGPRVAVLVADDQNTPASVGFVMPSIVGLTVGTANARLAPAGLHIAAPAPPPVVVPDPTTASAATPPASSAPAGAPTPQDPAIPPTVAPAAPAFRYNSVITSQSPLPGRRVSRADTIHVTVTNPTETPADPTATPQ